VRHGPTLGEGKKETLSFTARLNLFKFGDMLAFMTKARCTFCSHISDYVSKERCAFLGSCLFIPNFFYFFSKILVVINYNSYASHRK
jgi:hypothetical protein